MNYALYSRGIASFEVANNITRGARDSWKSFNCAFGMVPNKALISVPGCLVAETAMTAVRLTHCCRPCPDAAKPTRRRVRMDDGGEGA
jgi:hypothetical protein